MATRPWGVLLLTLPLTSASADPPQDRPRADDMPTFTVRPGKLTVTVTGRGVVEDRQRVDIRNQVEGVSTIAWLVPEGTRVSKGQVLCELDASGYRKQLQDQELATREAQLAYMKAQGERQIAEVEVKGYVEGTALSELEDRRLAVASAELTVKRDEARLKRSKAALEKVRRMLPKPGGAETPEQVAAEEALARNAESDEWKLGDDFLALDQAKLRLDVFTKFEREKRTKELQFAVEAARSGELSRKLSWELEMTRVALLRRKVECCTVVAPCDGVVTYANQPLRPGAPIRHFIAEGAAVRGQQVLFHISPNDPGPDAPAVTH